MTIDVVGALVVFPRDRRPAPLRACLDKLAGARPGDAVDEPSWIWRQPRSWLLDVTRTVRM